MGLRWALNCSRWNPTMEQFSVGLNMIQEEERKRICSFVFKKDVKTALIGRLMIRKAIRIITGKMNHEIKLTRSQNGRPYLSHINLKLHDHHSISKKESRNNNFETCNLDNSQASSLDHHDNMISMNKKIDFNISHDAEIVVLACEDSGVGVDVMESARPVGSGSIGKFFELMQRQFHENEWRYIKDAASQQLQLQCFYRLWCMKESFVKALGDGIAFQFQRIECCIQQQHNLEESVNALHSDVLTSSSIKVDGETMKDYRFEESLLLGRFLTCVAVHNKHRTTEQAVSNAFTMMTFDKLVDDERVLKSAAEMQDIVDQFKNNFETFNLKDYSPL